MTNSSTLTPQEARLIAKDAFIYAYPMVDSYRILFAFFLWPNNDEYKGPLNTLLGAAQLFTPSDTTIQTPNADTPYCVVGADLRAEPLVLTVPDIDPKRYYSIQLIDTYTHNFEYVGTRTTGGGNYLLAGPDWTGQVPAGITAVIRSETNLALALYRTQLFDSDDLGNVEDIIKNGYKVQPLSQFTNTEPPAKMPAVRYPRPVRLDEDETSPRIFSLLNFLLTTFCSTHASETELMARFAKLNIGPGLTFNPTKLSEELKQAIEQGIKDGWDTYLELKQNKLATSEVTAADLFGTREHLTATGNIYLYRMAGAILGIWGNSIEEAMYPSYYIDADGNELNASGDVGYTLRFEPGELPPADAFWSATMYNLPEQLLVENKLERYLINSTMLDNNELVLDEDGGLTLYIQHAQPTEEKKKKNWLPAPDRAFFISLRLYLPQQKAINGTWQNPPLQRVTPTLHWAIRLKRILLALFFLPKVSSGKMLGGTKKPLMANVSDRLG
ncbi:DUF1254 domain-containing protein [Leptolyngbya cf. ectocarpi LEGE 11479]|uniref:DUF1254 domain-containing protein n=1 Tax=Leptolyngbya cf. ectocarpi LEGE 11479 TaxID=1828722 RepID=A0A928ZTX4_LEPEC|nr:DUF1254 domain-containing protein [Leptolyngbya ectocarpi]MBE9067369.1 DUF1254 domain-containing protein [Leptolyngbya cf. ectocarpi LEGE 11479]